MIYLEAIKEFISLLGGLALKETNVLENLLVDLHVLLEPDRIFTQKVKMHDVGLLQCDVLISEGAAAHSIGLVLTLLISGSECKSINQVHGRGTLTNKHLLVLEICHISTTDSLNLSLETTSHLKLLHIRLALQGTASCQEDVLGRVVDVFLPGRQPRLCVVVNNLGPLVTCRSLWNRSILTQIECHLLRLDSQLYTDLAAPEN